jgi:hypothetical protein
VAFGLAVDIWLGDGFVGRESVLLAENVGKMCWQKSAEVVICFDNVKRRKGHLLFGFYTCKGDDVYTCDSIEVCFSCLSSRS